MEILLPLCSFIVIAALTPGPNNLLLATTGMRFGFRAAVPHIIGIQVGASTLKILCAFGLGQLIAAEPRALLLLKIFGSGYLLYLAWKILAIDFGGIQNDAKPLTVWQSIIFQFFNPKAWMMATTGIGIGVTLLSSLQVAVVALVVGFATLGLICNVLWAWAGVELQQLYTRKNCRFWLNLVLALITLLTALWFWFP